MRLNHRMAINLFEAAEGIGVRRERLVTPLGLDAAALVDPRIGVDWDVLVALLDQLSKEVGGNIERLRDVGRRMVAAPSFALLQRIARTVLSLQSLYLAGDRWIATANIPHLVLQTTFPEDDRMHFRCTIPEPYAPSAPYLHIFEGLLCEVPKLLGLPPATIVTTNLTPRSLDLVLQLPTSRSLFDRARRVARAAVHRADVLHLLEAQRREITAGLEAVHRSNAELHALLERLPDLVVVHREGTIVWLNRAAVETFGYDDACALTGKPYIDLFHPSSHAVAKECSGLVEAVKQERVLEAKLVARDGSDVLVEVSAMQSVSFGGRDARLLVARDVTERKRMREQLSIADRLASVGLLAAGVAHEVNNPLAYVLNNIEIARRELVHLGQDAEPSRSALAVALEGVDRIRTITHDLLVLARVDDAAVAIVDVEAIVESTLTLAAPQIFERARLVRELVPTPPALGTASRIGQVLLNLIANSLEAMSPTTRDTNMLQVAVRPSTREGALIEVSDNGIGIAPEHAARVFEPFFTTKALGRGTGLGLAISHRLISEFGGSLTFESTLGVGTTFRITLPPADGAGVVDRRATGTR
jgi:PAS domain S-box-containing protein